MVGETDTPQFLDVDFGIDHQEIFLACAQKQKMQWHRRTVSTHMLFPHLLPLLAHQHGQYLPKACQ